MLFIYLVCLICSSYIGVIDIQIDKAVYYLCSDTLAPRKLIMCCICIMFSGISLSKLFLSLGFILQLIYINKLFSMSKDSKTNLDLFSSDSDNKKNNKCMKWLKSKYYYNKKRCTAIGDIRHKKVYLETLSVSSVKRSLNRICKKIFKPRSSGYEKFLSDEEKRLYLATDQSLVEGIY